MTMYSRREWLTRAGMGAAAVAFAPRWMTLASMAEEPQIKPSPLNTLTDEDEIALGRRLATQLEKEAAIYQNPLIDRYLAGLMQNLAAKSQRPNLPYEVKFVNSHVINAFSLPGGFLYVNRGLIESIETEQELMAAMAHEIGHIAARHAVNRIMFELHAHSMLKPVLDNLHTDNGVIEQAVVKMGGVLAVVAMLHFSRRDESEADLLGFYEMLRAGWDPRGFLELFSRFDAMEKASGSIPVPFLSDHPPTPDRAAAIRRELTKVNVPAGATTDSMKFKVFKAALGLLPPAPKPAEAPPQADQPQPQGPPQ